MAMQENSVEKLTQCKSKVCDLELIHTETDTSGSTSAAVAIDGLIPKVHLQRFNFDDFFANKAKYLQSNELTKKGKKRKLQEIHLEESGSRHTNRDKIIEQIQKRGRSRKLQKVSSEKSLVPDEIETENSKPNEIKRRGRPPLLKKGVTDKHTSRQIVPKPISKEWRVKTQNRVKPSVENRKRFNGDPNLSTARIRKPNSRLQGFVVSSGVRYGNLVEKPSKEVIQPKVVVQRPKEVKQPKVAVQRPKDTTQPKVVGVESKDTSRKMSESTITDPLDTSSDDFVRSFLPVFDETSSCNESDVQEVLATSDNTEKENLENNLQPKSSKNNIQKLKSPERNESKLSPPKQYRRHNSKTETPPVPAPKNVIINTIDLTQPKPQKRTSVVNDTIIQQKKAKLKEPENEIKSVVAEQSKKIKVASPKVETKVNGSNTAVKQEKNHTRYGLFDYGVSMGTSKAKSSDVDFNKLVRSLKSVKLPAANWKIRIVVSKQQTITEVTFTNKEEDERCVKFSRTFSGYVITFAKLVVKLLGAPPKISSFNDVSVLLDIVHNISSNDPVLEYIA